MSAEIPQNEVIPDNTGSSSMKMSYAIPQNEVVPDHPEVPQDEVVPDSSSKAQFGTPIQQGITALEGAAKGATFGLSTKAETMAGVPEEDIKARQQENPMAAIGGEAAGTIGSMFVPGVGEGWILGKAAKALVPIANEASAIAKVGRLALRGMYETMGFSSGDEISDAFLHKDKDAAAVASHIIGSGATGLLTGGLFGGTGKGLEAVQDAKLGEYLDNFAIGLGSASHGGTTPDMLSKIYEDAGMSLPKGMKHGMKFNDEISNQIAKSIKNASSGVGVGIGAGAGAKIGSILGPIGTTAGGAAGARIGYKLAEKWIDPAAEKLASKVAPILTKKVAVPIMLQAIKLGETSGISQVLNYGTKAAAGARATNQALDSLFRVGGSKSMGFELNPQDREKLGKYIENGGIDQQIQQLQSNEIQEMPGYAEGGEVRPKPISSESGLSKLYPAQHMMLTAAKGRVSNYLNSIRPLPQMNKLMFDPKQDNSVKQRLYNNALDIANSPLRVLQHIQDGTIQAEHVKHLNQMYPEVYDHLSKKITERLVHHQSEETKPSYQTRQGLSLFLGSSLDTTMTPMGIQSIQSTFMPKQQPQAQQPQVKTKKGTSTLGKDNKSYRTAAQAAESDRTARD